MTQTPRKVHYHYVGPEDTIRQVCQRWRSRQPTFYFPGSKPVCSMDPAQVTCLRCRRWIARRIKTEPAQDVGGGGA